MYTYVLNYFYVYIYMYLFPYVEREKIVSRETFYVLSHAYLEIYTYALILCVERERERKLYHSICIYTCTYFHVFWIESVFYSIPKPIPYYCLSL